MNRVILFSLLLLLGLAGSQALPAAMGPAYAGLGDAVRLFTMTGLAFIMVHVGYEFDLDKSRLRDYGWDYVVAFTAAGFPWVFVTLYFVFVLLPPGAASTPAAWRETLLAGRFASPTSAGVLFSMLAAAGLGGTWLYRKARVLAIFDDLDTVLLMIPLKMLIVGLAWQLGLAVVMMGALLFAAYRYLHRLRIPASWPWVLCYSAAITLGSEAVYRFSKLIDDSVPVHIEVLLPAFVLGCVMAYPRGGSHSLAEKPAEKKAAGVVAAAFMLLVGLSMPAILGRAGPGGDRSPAAEASLRSGDAPAAEAEAAAEGKALHAARFTAAQPPPGWGWLLLHVLLVTLLANLGKMFPAFCYRREAHWRERIAVAVGMWPRGEVGAGVLVISLSYGIGGPVVTVAMLSLALNLGLTGFFIYAAKKITKPLPSYA